MNNNNGQPHHTNRLELPVLDINTSLFIIIPIQLDAPGHHHPVMRLTRIMVKMRVMVSGSGGSGGVVDVFSGIVVIRSIMEMSLR